MVKKIAFSGGTVVTWSKDDQILSADNVKVLNDDRIILHHEEKKGVNISIINLRGDDSGVYKCSLNFNKKALHVKHKLQVEGSIISTLKYDIKYALTVAPSIHFLQPSQKIIIRRGSDIKLECRANGHPQPVIRWMRKV